MTYGMDTEIPIIHTVSRSSWYAEEDNILKKMCQTYSRQKANNWQVIARALPG
jgi:hypothetical protein